MCESSVCMDNQYRQLCLLCMGAEPWPQAQPLIQQCTSEHLDGPLVHDGSISDTACLAVKSTQPIKPEQPACPRPQKTRKQASVPPCPCLLVSSPVVL